MRKAWALIDVGDILVGQPFETEEAARAALEGMSYFGGLLEVREIDFNDEPLDEEGEALKKELWRLHDEMGIRHFHMTKGPKFYAMSLKERYQFVINMLTKDHAEIVDVDD